MRTIKGAQIWRWRHVAKTQARGGMPALRKMMHLPPLPTTVRTDLPAVRRAIEASQRNAADRPSGQNSQQANETSSGGEHA